MSFNDITGKKNMSKRLVYVKTYRTARGATLIMMTMITGIRGPNGQPL